VTGGVLLQPQNIVRERDAAVVIGSDAQHVLASAEPDTYYWTRHHHRSPLLLLVRLGQVEPDELEELLRDSHRIASN